MMRAANKAIAQNMGYVIVLELIKLVGLGLMCVFIITSV
jgi:hypothetical protein